MMQVSDIMSTDVYACRPEDTLRDAVNIMREIDCGAVPVVDGRRELVGILTDRDICIRAAERDEPLTSLQVSDAVTWKPITCEPDESIESAESKLSKHQVRRLPVVDAGGALVGILALGDIAWASRRDEMDGQTKLAGVIAAISRPTHSSQPHV